MSKNLQLIQSWCMLMVFQLNRIFCVCMHFGSDAWLRTDYLQFGINNLVRAFDGKPWRFIKTEFLYLTVNDGCFVYLCIKHDFCSQAESENENYRCVQFSFPASNAFGIGVSGYNQQFNYPNESFGQIIKPFWWQCSTHNYVKIQFNSL